MDVLLLSRLLKELIIDNDRIPLPGIGYFQTEPMPAHFSEDGKTIYPPSKRISFKSDERAEGDMVSQYCAASTGMDAHTASVELDTFLQQLKITLQERKNVELPGLGRLRSTLDGTFYFVAEQEGGVFDQAFGFEPVILKPVRPAHETECKDNETPDSSFGNPPAVEIPAQKRQAPEQQSAPEPSDTEKRTGKVQHIIFVILAILAILIIAAIVVIELGRSGHLDRLIYSDEEIELIQQHGLDKQ